MRCARPTPPRTTRVTVRFGSSLSPPVTSLAAALLTALAAEPPSRPAGKHQPCCTIKSPRLSPGALLLRTAISQVPLVFECRLHAVDDDDGDTVSRRFELEPELVIERRHQRRAVSL